MSEEKKIPDEELPVAGSLIPETGNLQPEASEPPTSNIEPQTETMEVHHHGHVHEKKKWLEYVFQFFMLFLAVFCGFLAEYQLEHKIEKDRAKQYISSLYKDLKTDTATFSKILALNEKKREAFKDIFNCYDTLKKNWRATSCLIPLVKNSRFVFSVSFENGTLLQLKNAGGYRLLNDGDRDSIVSYDNSIQDYKDFESTIFQQSQDIVRVTFSMISDFTSNKFLYPDQAGADSNHIEMPLLFSDDKVLLNKYFNDLLRYRTSNMAQIGMVKIRQAKAIRLIEYFKNKYHFE